MWSTVSTYAVQNLGLTIFTERHSWLPKTSYQGQRRQPLTEARFLWGRYLEIPMLRSGKQWNDTIRPGH